MIYITKIIVKIYLLDSRGMLMMYLLIIQKILNIAKLRLSNEIEYLQLKIHRILFLY